MLSSPRRPSSTMRIFFSAENCRRVARRMSFTTFSADFLNRPGFLSHLRSLKGYDEPEILPTSNCQICLTGADVGHTQRRLQSAKNGNASERISASYPLRWSGSPTIRGPGERLTIERLILVDLVGPSQCFGADASAMTHFKPRIYISGELRQRLNEPMRAIAVH